MVNIDKNIDNIIIIPKLIEKTLIKENILYKYIKGKSNAYIKEIYEHNDFKHKRFDINLSYWSSICYPNVIKKDKMINITNFYTLLFIIDDILENNDSDGLIAKRYMNILKQDLENYNILEKKFKEVLNLIKEDLSYMQLLRFINYTKEWIEGANFLSNNYNIEIDRELYITHRIKSIGAKISFFTIEYGMDIEINYEKLNNDLLESLEKIHKVAAENIIFVNDLFSYRKEMYENNNNPNIIKIIMKKKNCNLQQAINILEEYIKNNYEIFNNLRDKILTKYKNDNLKKYLYGIYDLLIGNLQWSCVSPRYHGLNFNNTLINGAKIILDKYKTIIID